MQPGLPLEKDLKKDPSSLYEGVAYQQFWTGNQRQRLDELEHTLVNRLLPGSGGRIIDIGCGYGRLADCYLERYQQVVMVDGALSLLRQAMENTQGRGIYIACDITHLPFQPASFDAILMVRVFHHLPDSQACLTELYRLLCDQGTLVFNYCNKQNARRIYRWLIGGTRNNPFSLKPTGVGSLFISHHPKAVQAMLRTTGFEKVKPYGAGVIDRIVSHIGGIREGWKHLAIACAPFLAQSRIAPWIFCKTSVRKTSTLRETDQIQDLLQCPTCGGRLVLSNQGYGCHNCTKCYPVIDGMIDLRI